MKFKSIALTLSAGVLFLAAFGPLQTLASTAEISSRPILFVHGFNVFGLPEDCKHDWGTMESTLAANGYTGKMTTVSYYFDDTNCDVKTSPKGSILTPIEDLSKNLAWYIYDQYSSKNVDLDIVAHSMGGLLVRYALYRVAAGDSTFPPFLKVPHVATMGVPFTGYSTVAELCHVIPVNVQCWEMFPLSSFIEDLKNPLALVPQGIDGTLWSAIGSNALFLDDSDGFVNSKSANSMEIPATAKSVLPWHMFVFHMMYTHNKTVIADVIQSLSLNAAQASVAHAIPTKLALPALSSRRLASADAVLTRDEISQVSQNSQDSMGAQTEPELENGETVGIRFTSVLSSGIFAKMGIQEGDVVRGCNQDNINSPFEALDILETSSGPIPMNFCLVRGGEMISKQIVIQ